jgi:hypothetical protein
MRMLNTGENEPDGSMMMCQWRSSIVESTIHITNWTTMAKPHPVKEPIALLLAFQTLKGLPRFSKSVQLWWQSVLQFCFTELWVAEVPPREKRDLPPSSLPRARRGLVRALVLQGPGRVLVEPQVVVAPPPPPTTNSWTRNQRLAAASQVGLEVEAAGSPRVEIVENLDPDRRVDKPRKFWCNHVYCFGGMYSSWHTYIHKYAESTTSGNNKWIVHAR